MTANQLFKMVRINEEPTVRRGFEDPVLTMHSALVKTKDLSPAFLHHVENVFIIIIQLVYVL